jgi:hypothetical protein
MEFREKYTTTAASKMSNTPARRILLIHFMATPVDARFSEKPGDFGRERTFKSADKKYLPFLSANPAFVLTQNPAFIQSPLLDRLSRPTNGAARRTQCEAGIGIASLIRWKVFFRIGRGVSVCASQRQRSKGLCPKQPRETFNSQPVS